jgi:hypothetical protein
MRINSVRRVTVRRKPETIHRIPDRFVSCDDDGDEMLTTNGSSGFQEMFMPRAGKMIPL